MTKITAVLLDMVGSTEIEKRVGIKAMVQLKNDLFEAVSTVSKGVGGTRANFFGDGALIVFEGKDSSIDACFFVSKLFSQLSETNVNERGEVNSLHLRCGIDTGNLEYLDDRNLTGMPINVASRLSAICLPDQVIVAKTIAESCRSRGMSFSPDISVRLKGIGETIVNEFLWDGRERGVKPVTPPAPEAPRAPHREAEGDHPFVFEVVTLKNRQMISPEDLPLTIEGKYATRDRIHIWVLLQDSYGNYYLQNPEVQFLPEGRWIAMNVLPGKGITFVHFCRVGDNGHSHFLSMVARKEWGGFTDLPEGSTLIVSLSINRI